VTARLSQLLRCAIRGSTGSTREVRFGVHLRNDNRQRTPPLVRLKGVCGPGARKPRATSASTSSWLSPARAFHPTFTRHTHPPGKHKRGIALLSASAA
jgi:hypothetical protein